MSPRPETLRHAPTLGRAISAREWWLSGILATLFWIPPLRDGDATGWGDWQYFHHMWEAGRIALERGEWPVWDPFHCGGVTLWGNPQSQTFSPFFLLSLLVGSTWALKIHLWAHAFAGAAGMFAFAREERMPAPARTLAAAVWTGSGFFAWHLAGGHSAFAPFYLVPWVLVFWRRSLRDVRWSLALALTMMSTLLSGGVYPFPYFVLLLGFEASRGLGVGLVRGEFRLTLARVLRAGVVSGTLTLLLGAVRLIPILDTLAATPRLTATLDSLEPWQLFQALTSQNAPEGWLSRFSWPEYGAYLGPVVLGLALVALARRRAWGHGFAVLFFASLALGDHGELSTWQLLHHLPVFDSLRVPSRFLVYVSFFVALLAGDGLTELEALTRRYAFTARRAGRELTALLGVAAVLTLFGTNTLGTVDRWDGAPVEAHVSPREYHLTAAPYLPQYAQFPARNVGTRQCYDPMNVHVAGRLWTGESPQVRVPRGGELHAFSRSTTGAIADVELREEGAITINQNYFRGWTTSVGTIDQGSDILKVVLPAGRHHVVLRYEPPRAGLALALTGAGSLLCLVLLLLARPCP